jgi:hypothetical protein
VSADNFVGVRPNADGTYSIFEYGNMSVYGEDCMYLSESKGDTFVESREKALVVAHDLVNEMDVCEYGVIEMGHVRDKPCGRCFVCVHERNIVSEDLQKCSGCDKPISEGEWQVSNSTGTYHTRCDPSRVKVNAS